MVNHYFESGGFSSQTIFRKEISSQILKFGWKTLNSGWKISYPDLNDGGIHLNEKSYGLLIVLGDIFLL